MTTYNIRVIIDDAQLKLLKEQGYSLCMSKKFDGYHRVLFSSNKDFEPTSTVTWKEKYEVFESNGFKPGALVLANSKKIPVQPGQTIVIDDSGALSVASGSPDSSGVFKVKSGKKAITIGMNQEINGKMTTIFVSDPLPSGVMEFDPMKIVGFWFAKEVKTGEMLAKANNLPLSCEVGIDPGETTDTIKYFGGNVGFNGWSGVP